MMPSTGGSGAFSIVESSGFVVGVIVPLPRPSGVANVTLFGASTALPFPLSGVEASGSAITDGGEVNVGKSGGN